MDNRTYYYARVSSKNQHEDRQIDKFKSLGADDSKIIIDKESGKDLDRTGYRYLRDNLLREGDILVVTSLDRLSRNKADAKSELQYYKDKNIRVKILDIPTTLIDAPEGQEWIIDMVQNILIEVLCSISENERLTIHRRQAEGIESAQKRGVKFGRPVYVKPDNFEEMLKKVDRQELRAVDAMRQMGMKKSTYYKLRAEIKQGVV
jgi:DNA invertase Pin-like site-specific DNA recombinase